MLLELHVRDLALVEEVWLELGPGLTVLSGETGAGKTVLVSALKLLLGERADSAMVRQGAPEALVEGRFVLDGREVLVRRRLTAEGRSRCAIDGEMASVSMLADVLGPHLDLHGQHEHQALLSVSHHRGYLDRFIGTDADEALARYRAAFQAAQAACDRLASVERTLAERERRAEYLRFQVADMDAVAPGEGEDAELEARLPRLRFAERLAAASGAAWTALREEGGATDRLATSVGALMQARDLDPALDTIADSLAALEVELQESAAALRDYAAGIEHDPAALDETEHRMRQLTDLARKYGGSLADAIRTRHEALRELEVLDEGESALERAQAVADEARADLRSAAEHLSAVRAAAVDAFTERLQRAAADLALPNAIFAVSLTVLPEDAWTPDGPQRVEFLFASAAGERPRPLAKIASGGEISRVMLALKSVLGAADDVPVLVFDEVDAGIGGATALAVGRRLAALAADHQVLVVTHLPQVAAYADTQVVVARAESAGRSVTTAYRLEADARVQEIARMLAGGSTEAGLAHAGELLEQAGREREKLVPTVASAD